MVAVGREDLWLPVGNVIGPLPAGQPNDGSVRVTGIDRSTDGGLTWSFTGLPGCLQECGNMPSLSFLDALQGFAAIGPDHGGTQLFFTGDGGVTWVPVAGIPTADGARIEFTSPVDGWAVGTYAFAGGSGDAGRLYRTSDGGLTWSPAPGLPSNEAFQIPTFFNSNEGVLLGRDDSISMTSESLPLVYDTEDGGTNWTAHRIPAVTKVDVTAFYDRTENAASVPFDAVSPADWKLYVGPDLYGTTNAGHTWVKVVPTPMSAAGSIGSIAFSSSTDGIAMVQKPGCAVASGGGCYPVLIDTTDGGRHWLPQMLP